MKYIGYYDVEGGERNVFLAGINKMKYISYALNEIGVDVEIISCSMSAKKRLPAEVFKLNDKTSVKLFKAYPQKNKFVKIVNLIKRNLTLFLYLLKNTKKNEQILVYHSLGIMRCIYWAKKIKKFRLILEVEEFYNDVNLKSKFSRLFENKFIRFADKYIFTTELLNIRFNNKRKPYILCHGTYKNEKNRNVSFEDNKHHIVYAGTFDPRKGVYIAAETARYLSEKYHIHIIGFGSKIETESIQTKVDEINKDSLATIAYDGMLTGESYIEFLQKCQIGLCPQDPDATYNDTSFPSKILSYMSNGLRVVTIRIPAIETSAVNNDVFFYDEQTPEKIAETIQSINLQDNYSARKKIEELDRDFKSCMLNLIEEN